jgi:hypothetical protein
MNLWSGIVMLALAFLLIWAGRPDKGGVHPKLLRFDAALVLYPPLVLTFFALGTASVISGLFAK